MVASAFVVHRAVKEQYRMNVYGGWEYGAGRCNGKCYFCWLENMTLKTRIWRWVVG